MNQFKLLVILFTTLLFCSIANAEVTPGPEAKTAGDLGLVIVASDSPDYIKEWLNTPPSHGVTIKRLEVTRPGQLVVTSFLVTGFTSDRNGDFSIAVSFVLLDPKGKELFSQPHYAKASGKAPEVPTYIMADPAVDIVLDKTDQEGEYTIVGVVEDLISKKTARSSYKIKFEKDGDDFDK